MSIKEDVNSLDFKKIDGFLVIRNGDNELGAISVCILSGEILFEPNRKKVRFFTLEEITYIKNIMERFEKKEI